MRTWWLAAALICGCEARANEPFWRGAAGALSSTAIRAHVEYLTDELLEGRRAASRPEALAARYVAAQLEGYGLSVERKLSPLPAAVVVGATLSATHDNVRVELRYGTDFVFRVAPPLATFASDNPVVETPTPAEWDHLGPAAATARLTPIEPGARPRIAIAPPAATQLPQAGLKLQAQLDLAPLLATDVRARLPGAERCVLTLSAHHDGFGPGFPGAADGAAGVAVMLEVARGLAQTHRPPRCTVLLRSYGGAEWTPALHPEPPVPPELAARRHAAADRISRDWDWEDLKRRAQQVLTAAGEGQGGGAAPADEVSADAAGGGRR
jgi:hypothetical protein